MTVSEGFDVLMNAMKAGHGDQAVEVAMNPNNPDEGVPVFGVYVPDDLTDSVRLETFTWRPKES